MFTRVFQTFHADRFDPCFKRAKLANALLFANANWNITFSKLRREHLLDEGDPLIEYRHIK